jgi:hypothetical protein
VRPKLEVSDDLAWPLRLYFGNPKAQAPNYDFSRFLPATLVPEPSRAQWSSAGVQPNPTYVPEPKPWSERWPWLVYVVLGTASLVLLVILAVLARKALVKSDPQHAHV